MIIQGAALINRFYISDGWTKKKVAELLKYPLRMKDKIKCVTSRIFTDYDIKSDKSKEISSYYAVYPDITSHPEAIFNKEKVMKHEYKPFTMLGSKIISHCNKSFGSKNKWE